jgi:A/G-specific adenine glycosylase
MVDDAREHEQQIGQPVHILDQDRVRQRRERDDPALRAPADGARHMQRGAGRRTTGEDEPPERRQLRLQAVDQGLQPFDVGIRQRRLDHALRDPLARIRELRSEREQVLLNANERVVQIGVQAGGAGQAKPGIQFVDIAVRVDPTVGLADPAAVEQRRLASVASAGVDFHGRPKVYEMPVRRPERRRLSLPTTPERRRFRRRLLTWYRRHGRDLPWRQTDDPYHILVSEIMLQQTQVDRVLPKYVEWLDRFPSLEALAAAPEGEVNAAWYPLGYNIRPRRLQTIAREAVERYGGQLPADEETLLSFKGIGAYTAGAIRSFAFRQRAAILDTNVARVLFRVFVGKGDLKSHAMKRHLWTVSEALVPRRDVFDFNQALMDLGAMVCVARNPKCLGCPMVSACRSSPSAGRSAE